MGFVEESHFLGCAVTDELGKDYRDNRTAYSRIEFSVAECACSPFPELNIAFGVQYETLVELLHFLSADFHGITSFQNYRFCARFTKREGGEKSARTRSHHHGALPFVTPSVQQFFYAVIGFFVQNAAVTESFFRFFGFRRHGIEIFKFALVSCVQTFFQNFRLALEFYP